MNATEIKRELHALASPAVATQQARFFKTGPGEYGHGDQFIGVRVPVLRKLARGLRTLADKETLKILRSKIHEERLLALLIWVEALAKATPERTAEVYELYVANMPWVNNWDLVDSSAAHIVGAHLFTQSRAPLKGFSTSSNLWERRIAIVATNYFIRHHDFSDTLKISRTLLRDEHDLIHKAVGWMLREVGKRHEPTLRSFLNDHAAHMPRTMLRYAIERLPETARRSYLAVRASHV